MTDTAISCRDLKKNYGSVEAVRGLDLEVSRGECFGLLGPNGAGKTTTIEILEGLNEPTSGEVLVLGQKWNGEHRQLRERLGITLQETHLPDKSTVIEILRLFRSFYRHGREVEDVLAKVALGEKRHARYEHLSGGQKQRLAVACALVGAPDLLFLDEPTTGLDPQSRRQLWDLVIDFRAGGGTVLLTTHYMEEAERLCDRVGIVDHGKLIALGSPRELIASLGGQEVVEFTTDAQLDAEALARLPGVKAARKLTASRAERGEELPRGGAEGLARPGDGWALTATEVHLAVPALLAHLEKSLLQRLSTHHATLEDVFVTLTGRQLRE